MPLKVYTPSWRLSTHPIKMIRILQSAAYWQHDYQEFNSVHSVSHYLRYANVLVLVLVFVCDLSKCLRAQTTLERTNATNQHTRTCARSFGSGQTRLSSYVVVAINGIMKFVQSFHHHLCGSRAFALFFFLISAEHILPAFIHVESTNAHSDKKKLCFVGFLYPSFVYLFSWPTHRHACACAHAHKWCLSGSIHQSN